MEGRQHKFHPDLPMLALLAGGELRGAAAWRMRRHLRRCGLCRGEAAAFRAARAGLQDSAERQALAAVPDWKRMEREMLGNIVVGVAAARCIEKIGRKHLFLSRAIWTCAAVAILFIAAWVTRLAKQRDVSVAANPESFPGEIVETTPGGIAVHTAGGSLTMLHPASAVVSLGRGPGVAASYIDEETGEVTITNVYGK